MSELREAISCRDGRGRIGGKPCPDHEATVLDAARRFLALTETGPERAWLTHRCWFHPEDRSTVCSLFSWIRQYQGTPEPCEVVSALVIPADYLTEETK